MNLILESLATLRRSDHCPAMKGIETGGGRRPPCGGAKRSDHCPAMKGIETTRRVRRRGDLSGSDHCPAMKGIETLPPRRAAGWGGQEATTAPQ